MRTTLGSLAVTLCLFLTQSAGARVVINEVMYHPPDDLEDLEFIELHNSGAQAVDIGGWALAKGVKLTFPPGTKVAPKGFVVVARSAERMREFYSLAPLAL